MSAIKESTFFREGFLPGHTPTARKLAMMADYESRKAHLRPRRKPQDGAAVERFREAAGTFLSPEKLGWFDRCTIGQHRKGRCQGCGQRDVTAKYEYTCGLYLCPKCWQGRLFADWRASKIALVLPEHCALVRLRPRNRTTLRHVMANARQWAKRQGLTSNNGGSWGYGCERQPEGFAFFATLVIDATMPLPEPSRDWAVDISHGLRSEAFAWISRHYQEILDIWLSPEELEYLTGEVKGIRRFQSFGLLYDAMSPLTAEEPDTITEVSGDNREATDMNHHAGCRCGECRERKGLGPRVQAKHHGGDGKTALRAHKDICPHCGAVDSIIWDQGFVDSKDVVFNPDRPDVLPTAKPAARTHS
jgi:hypothetical protein